MPPKLKSKSKTGFKGVRARGSGNFGAEFQCDNRRYWLGTFKTADLAARAFDIAAWRFGRPQEELNFLEIATKEDAEFISPSVTMVPVNEEEKKKKKDICILPGESDAEAMARFAGENTQYVQYEADFFWKRDAEKKEEVKKEDEAGPSTVINLDSEEEMSSGEKEDLAYWKSIDNDYVSDE